MHASQRDFYLIEEMREQRVRATANPSTVVTWLSRL